MPETIAARHLHRQAGPGGSYGDAPATWTSHPSGPIAPDEIVLFGESLRGAITAWPAAQAETAALIIHAGCLSLPKLARQRHPVFSAKLLVRLPHDTQGSLGKVSCPVLILHRREDEIIPFSHGEALFAAAREPRRLPAPSGHNDALQISRGAYARGVDVLLQALLFG